MVNLDYSQLAADIKQWGQELGFQQIGITDTSLEHYKENFLAWLANHFHGEMKYMAAHDEKRYRPDELIPDTLRIISVRINYLPPNTNRFKVLQNPQLGYVSRYALGRDYHKLIRKRLNLLAKMTQMLKIFVFSAEYFGSTLFSYK